MQEKGKPEAEQAPYRKKLDTYSAKVVVLEAAVPTGEVQAQRRYGVRPSFALGDIGVSHVTCLFMMRVLPWKKWLAVHTAVIWPFR